MSGTTGTSDAYNPTQSQDVVGIFDNDFNQLFADARPIKASIKERAKLMKHPVESGATITDFKVIQPVEIHLSMVLLPETYVNTYNQMKAVFLGNSTIQVQTNTGLYPNMLIADLPHEEDTAHFDTISMNIKLDEVIFATAVITGLPAASGTKTGKPASEGETNAAKEKVQRSTAGYAAYQHFFKGGNGE